MKLHRIQPNLILCQTALQTKHEVFQQTTQHTIFYAQIRSIKQTFHETENYVSDHVYGWYLGVESFFMGMNWLCVQKVYSDHSLQRKSFRVFIFIENWRLTNPRKYLTGAGMVKAVNRYRAEASQVILKSVTEPLNWRKKKFENVKQLRTTACNLKGKETKRHRHILKISSLKLSPSSITL